MLRAHACIKQYCILEMCLYNTKVKTSFCSHCTSAFIIIFCALKNYLDYYIDC